MEYEKLAEIISRGPVATVSEESQKRIGKQVDHISWLFSLEARKSPDLKPENVNEAFSSVEDKAIIVKKIYINSLQYADLRVWGREHIVHTMDRLPEGVFGVIWAFCDVVVSGNVPKGNVLFETAEIGDLDDTRLVRPAFWRHDEEKYTTQFALIGDTVYGVFQLKPKG
jgi:hypothetical protein